jgi:hypothetical protein
LARFQTRYQDVNYPENHVTASVNSLGKVTDQNNLFEHLLTNISPEIAHKSPYIASLSTTETLKIRSIFEQELILVTNFRFSDDKGVIDALNMNFNSSPLILELKMDEVDSSATNVNTYLEISSETVIEPDGMVSIVSKSAK